MGDFSACLYRRTTGGNWTRPSKFFPPGTSSALEVMYNSSISRTDLQQLLSSGPAVRASHASSATHLVTDSEPVNQKLVSLTAIIQRLSNWCVYSRPFNVNQQFGASLCHWRLSCGRQSENNCGCSKKDLRKGISYTHFVIYLSKAREGDTWSSGQSSASWD